METLLKRLFGLSLTVTSLAGLLAAGQGGLTGSVWTPPFLGGLAATVGLWIARRRLASNARRYGALTRRRRPPLTRDETARMASVVSQAYLDYSTRLKPGARPPSAEERLTMQALIAMRDSWNVPADADPAGGHDELRSSYKLLMFARTLTGTDADLQSPDLEDVADRANFLALRDRLLVARAEARAERDAYKAWLSHVGGTTDANHLLKDGWLSFLQSLPRPDIVLWHEVATDFHDITLPERMHGVLWILSQPDCDRATAAEFLRGFLYYDSLQYQTSAARRGELWLHDGLRAVIDRWNDGFYRQHRLNAHPDEAALRDLTEDRLRTKLEEAAQKAGVPSFAVPKGLLSVSQAPMALPPGLWRSPYDYSPGDGLLLRYPGPDWAKQPD